MTPPTPTPEQRRAVMDAADRILSHEIAHSSMEYSLALILRAEREKVARAVEGMRALAERSDMIAAELMHDDHRPISDIRYRLAEQRRDFARELRALADQLAGETQADERERGQ